MKIFYKNGFMMEGIHSNIPSDAVEISREYYNELLKEMNKGKTIVANDEGYPIAVMTLENWKKAKITEAEKEYEQTVNSSVEYNGCLYKPSNTNNYISLLSKYFEADDTLTIWDATNLEENAKEYSKKELQELIKVLSQIEEIAYQTKKTKIAQIKALNEIDETL